MNDSDAQVHAGLLVRIHEQLGPDAAAELTYYASDRATDDPTIFCVEVLARVRTGDLVLTDEEVALVKQRLRWP